mgnify:CR=1 FL=1
MDRAEFMALESSKKAEVLNALLDEGKNQKEAMGAVGVTIKDLMVTQVFFSKTEGRFNANAVGGYSNFHSDSTGEAAKKPIAPQSPSDRKRGLPQSRGGPRFCIPSEKPWVFQNGKGAGTLHELRRPERQPHPRLDHKPHRSHVQRIHAEGDFARDKGRYAPQERNGSPDGCAP